MNDISSIASVILGMRLSQTQEQINMSILKMEAQAEAAMADILMQNARQVEAMSHTGSGGIIDLFA